MKYIPFSEFFDAFIHEVIDMLQAAHDAWFGEHEPDTLDASDKGR